MNPGTIPEMLVRLLAAGVAEPEVSFLLVYQQLRVTLRGLVKGVRVHAQVDIQARELGDARFDILTWRLLELERRLETFLEGDKPGATTNPGTKGTP